MLIQVQNFSGTSRSSASHAGKASENPTFKWQMATGLYQFRNDAKV